MSTRQFQINVPSLPAGVITPADEAMLEGLQHAAFKYFLSNTNPDNGLVADTSREGSPSSIAVIGLALSAYPVAVERGWITRPNAVQRSLRVLQFLADSDQSGGSEATGYRGFYYHFLDMQRGKRVWKSELSLIDTALLIAGMLTAAAYFKGGTENESALRGLADALYRRVEWRWAGNPSVVFCVTGGRVTARPCCSMCLGWDHRPMH